MDSDHNRKRRAQLLNKAMIFCNWIRGYEFGDPSRNGEYRFARSFIKDGMVIFDVGANIGEFTNYILSLGENLELHCFEPVCLTYERLKKRLENHTGGVRLFLNPVGLSDRQGDATINIYGEYAGTNSLYKRCSAVATHPLFSTSQEQKITLTTLDLYVKERSVERIDLLKIDVEGHELKVLEGAVASLADGKVGCIQFEYGGCFQDSGARLEDIFKLMKSNGYNMFRLFPFGKIRVRSFYRRLENYRYSNWLAVLS